MCQLQFLMNLKGILTKRDIEAFLSLMTIGNVSNSDAFGLFNSQFLFKRKGAFKPRKVKNQDLGNDSFLVGHNRKVTNGSPEENQNNHPFELGEFLLVHNGMIQNHEAIRKQFRIPNRPETDSYVVLWLIDHYFKKSKANSRHKRILRGIKTACSLVEGWYSVFLFDKESQNLYYFRNKHARFAFALFEDEVIAGTTDPENFKGIYTEQKLLFKVRSYTKASIAEPEPGTIYLINREVKIQEAGKFKDGDDAVWALEGKTGEWAEGLDEFLIYEQCVADWVNDCLGYCPPIEVTGDGMVRIKADKPVKENIDFLCAEYSLKDGWYETDLECLYGVEEYLADWH